MSEILITMQHPADANQFKNTIKSLQEEHDIHVFVRDRDDTISRILMTFGIDHDVLVNQDTNNPKTIRNQLKFEVRLARECVRIEPDLIVSSHGVAATHVSKLCSCDCLIFSDTEHATLQNVLSFPFADYIYTPDCFEGNVWGNQIEYPGYHELSYLHPDVFSPDSSVFEYVEFEPDDTLVLLRLVAWNAVHDVGDNGFKDVFALIDDLEQLGANVLISSEEPLPEELLNYELNIPMNLIHDLMYYTDLFIGESATMATECAVLGTPSIFVSSSTRGYTNELGTKYGLVYTYSEADKQEKAMNKAEEILNESEENNWENKRQRMLNDKINTTEYTVDVIKDLIND